MGLLLFACVTEDNYVQYIAADWCRRQEECNLGDFESEFEDQADCVDETAEDWLDLQECAQDAGCEYDPEEVDECREELREQSCEDFVDGDWAGACDETYDCDDDEAAEYGFCALDWAW